VIPTVSADLASRRAAGGHRRTVRRFPGPALFLTVAGVAIVVVLTRGPAASGRPDAVSVRSYQEQLHTIAADGGRIVVREIQPALADLVQGRLAPQDFVARAQSWRTELEVTRERAARLRVPPGVEHGAALFDRSLREYEEAVSAFSRAALASDMPAAIRAAVPLASRADATYDQSVAVLRDELQAIGQPTIRQ